MPARVFWTPERKAPAQALLDSGLDDYAVAKELNLTWKQIANAVARRILHRDKRVGPTGKGRPPMRRQVNSVAKLISPCDAGDGPASMRGVGDMPGFDDY